ncbi:MAG TPA: ABC transporter substrate-binding protein [Alphaproteobacteria bacterium]|nr:ABC transporter substrate-binding protein [Alphaproteobacteria bacterium]
MKWITRIAMAAVLAAALASGTSAKTLRIGLAEDPDLLDPTLARTFVGRIVFASLCDKLFDISPDLKVVPQLATGYEWSADNKALTLKLRQGVVFQDGEPFNAEAVKFSIERHLTLQGSTRKSEINAIQSIDVLDERTVRLNLAKPFAPLLAALTDRAGMIVSPKAAKEEGKDFALHPVCAGPFKFVERVAQDRIVLEKFDKYWNKDNVHIDRIEYRPIIDNAVRVANLQSGSLDLIERVAPTDLPALRKDPKLQTAEISSLAYQGITINIANGPKAQNPLGQDPRVREAFDLAIDRGAIPQVVFNGEFTPGNQWDPVGNPYYVKEFPVHARNLEKAKALLKEAGHPDLVVNLMVPTTQEDQQGAQVLQAMVKEAGIDMRIQSVEFATSLDRAHRGDFEAWYIGWSGRTDPDGNLYSFVACKAPLNDGNYCNPEVDKALEESRSTNDPAARYQAYKKAAEILIEKDRPIIYLFQRKWIYGMTKALAGFTPYPDGLVRVVGVDLK